MNKSIFVSKAIWRTVLTGVLYLAPLTILELGMGIVIPSIFNPPSAEANQGSLRAFVNALGNRETRDRRDPYKVENTLGFIGRYQFGEAMLIDLGYYKPKNCVWYGRGANKNDWQGEWKRGIRDKQQFLNSPSVQNKAIVESFGLNLHYINSALRNDRRRHPSAKGVSLAGILAGAHLVGYQGAVAFITKGEVQRDPYGVPITEYIKQFNRYQIKPSDFGGARQPQSSGC
jgi:hypothetical protein